MNIYNALFYFFCFFYIESAFAKDVNMMPKVLVDYGKKHGCDQMTDYYDDPAELFEPPFVVLQLPYDEGSVSAAFWCKGKEGENDYRIFIYQQVESKKFPACPKEIKWDGSSGHPGGISMVYPSTQKLDQFRYLKNDAASKSKDATGVLVTSEHDGIAIMFFCSGTDGWLYKTVD